MKCKKCGSDNLVQTQGFSQRTQKSFSGPKCQKCHTWNFEAKNGTPKPYVKAPQAQAEVELLKQIVNELKQIKAKLPKGQEGPMDAVPF